MRIVIDSNILFAALIKDSMIRKMILEYSDVFLFPSYIFFEMEKHKEELLVKSGMGEEEFNKLLGLFLKKVEIVSNDKLKKYQKEALEIIGEIDIDDVLFIACALAYSDSLIWSDDKRLKEQNKVKILNTYEIKRIIDQK